MDKRTKQTALEKFFKISGQWNGNVVGKPITVAEGNEILGGIKYNMSLPMRLRRSAAALQQEIIMHNTSGMKEIANNG